MDVPPQKKDQGCPNLITTPPIIAKGSKYYIMIDLHIDEYSESLREPKIPEKGTQEQVLKEKCWQSTKEVIVIALEDEESPVKAPTPSEDHPDEDNNALPKNIVMWKLKVYPSTHLPTMTLLPLLQYEEVPLQ